VTAWYQHTFGREYLSLYRHRDDVEAADDVAHIVRLIRPPRHQPLLDLCCGAGRHLVAFRRAGYTDLTGLDLSEDLLDAARARLRTEAMTDVRLIRADMRAIPGDAAYATVVSLFTSFGYFADDAQDARVLHAVCRALRPGGTFLLDTLNRDAIVGSLVPSEERRLGAKQLRVRRRISSDGRRVEKLTRISQPGSPETVYRESVRMYTCEELEHMLADAQFVNVRCYGALDGRVYTPDAPRLVVSAVRKETECNASIRI